MIKKSFTNNEKRKRYDHDLKIVKSISKESFRKFLENLSKITQYTFNHFGDINSETISDIIQKELTRVDKIKFFSLVDDDLIAYSFLTKFDKPSKKHNCILGIVIGDAWQNKGYGKKICQYMIKTAWKHGYEKIWLNVHADNARGIKLYRSLGFEIEGIFMYDEIENAKSRNMISMAIFKEKKFDKNERQRIWKNIGDNYSKY